MMCQEAPGCVCIILSQDFKPWYKRFPGGNDYGRRLSWTCLQAFQNQPYVHTPAQMELSICTSSSLDLLIDKQLSTQTKETWEGHRITILCAVRLPTGQTGVKFSWMHIPSNRTVSKQFHEELRGKSYLTITTLKDEDFESLQCRAETASTVKFHVIDIIKLSEYIDWFYWKPRGASRSGLFLADKTKAVQFLFPLD